MDPGMRRLLLVISALLVCAYSYAQLEHKVVFTLAPDEELYMGEYASARIMGQDRYCCMVQNINTGDMTFIWNGQRIVTAPFVEVCCFDLEDLSNCVYMWQEPGTPMEKWYIRTSFGLFGPYDMIQYLPACESFGMVRPGGLGIDHPSWLYKDSFIFCQYGQTYVCQDGAIVKIADDTEWEEYVKKMASPGVSPNGRHYARIVDDKIICDGESHYFRVPESATSVECCALDDGKVYICFNDGADDFLCFILDPEEMELTPLEKGSMFYDFRTMDVVYKPFSGIFSFLSNTTWQASELDIVDESGEHVMTVDYRNTYVLIDGEAYGDAPAISAFYDSRSNAFVWVSENGGIIKRYTYKL